jgi:hypothetical protein
MFSLFHYIGLAVLVAGEVRAYRFHGQLARALGVPLAYWLLPGIANYAFVYMNNTPTLLGLSDLVPVAWVLIGVAWGGWQLLKYRKRRADTSITEQSREEVSATDPSSGDRPLSRTAVASLCLGLLGLVGFILVIFVFRASPELPDFLDRSVWPLMGMIPVIIIAGIACGRLARVDIQGGKSRGARVARAGLALNYTAAISIVVAVVWFVAWFVDSLAGI